MIIPTKPIKTKNKVINEEWEERFQISDFSAQTAVLGGIQGEVTRGSTLEKTESRHRKS